MGSYKKCSMWVVVIGLFLTHIACGGSDSNPSPVDSGPDGDSDSDGDGDSDSDGDGDGDTDSDSDDDTDDIDTDGIPCQTPADAGKISFSNVPTWRDGATAAYSMFHDDLCDYGVRGIQENAVPALNERGLSAGLGAIAAECEAGDHWEMVAQLESQGHEILNHSYDHDNVTPSNIDQEVVAAKETFDQHLSNPVSFYIFPYDYFTDETIAAVLGNGHIGARGGNRDDNDGFTNPPINGTAPASDGAVEFDVWPRTYSKYALYYPEDILSVHVWQAIKTGGWATREFHSVIKDGEPDEGNGFGPIELSAYEAHLDFLVDAYRKNKVWTANPSTVIRYRHAREACDATVNGSDIVYNFSDPDCSSYATPISVIVTTEHDVASLEGRQGTTFVYTRKLAANTFAVTANPTAGDVALSGCADPGHGVDDGDIAPEPLPADSVCDIVSVVGTGGNGMMDDLERPEDEFQVLPNPAQGDGRTGSWSWYPQNAGVEMTDDGGNTVVSYAGTDLGGWSGLTLAFLGGNGAGACYDAGAYSGLQFRIKGTVLSGDELDGKIILSLVTAETQAQAYGGDLDGEGGHFNYQVTLTDAWQTVTLTWDQFNPPTWGDTANLTELAVEKMQAIDWGVSNQASSFQIYVDDIELL